MKFKRMGGSPRYEFQFHYAELAPDPGPDGKPNILNIGSCNDPLGFGEYAMHVDMDDWSAVHKYFIQADAADLPIPDHSYHTVILGDIMEHVLYPVKVVEEACRVCDDTLVFTVFEEWTLPGHGQFIKEGQAHSDEASQKLGFKDRFDYQEKTFGDKRVGVDDNLVPHLVHINQFNDEDMESMAGFIVEHGYEALELYKALESTGTDGHQWSNWLLAFRRIK